MPLLQSWGVRGVVLDLDNTIVPWHTSLLPESIRAWASSLRAAAIGICLLTNNYSRSAQEVATMLAVPVIHSALKPLPAGFRKSLTALSLPAAAVLVVGDQLFTDVLGARLCGMRAVIVHPMSTRDFVTTKLLRLLERPLLARLRREGVANA